MVPANTTRKKAFRLSRLFDLGMVAISVFGGSTWILHDSRAGISMLILTLKQVKSDGVMEQWIDE